MPRASQPAVLNSPPMKLPLALLSISLLASCCAPPEPRSQTQFEGETVLSARELREAAAKPVVFSRHVKPILEAKCAMCHNRQALPGRMSLENREMAATSGALGTFIVPGHPEKSLFITNVSAAHSGVHAMPPVGERMTDEELVVIKKWIQEGAQWPEGRAGVLDVD